MVRYLIVGMLLVLTAPSAWPYQPLKDDINGGNPKLAKTTYRVFVGKEPDGSGFRQEAVNALNQWRTALAARGVTLDIQAGEPPNDPVDLKKYKLEIDRFNKDPIQDPANYPEMAKVDAKQNTLSVYFRSSADIQKMGAGSEKGWANSLWNLDTNGKAGVIEESDIFIPTDPPGGTADIKKQMIYNITLHEGGHAAGAGHYTTKQVKDGGQVMQLDATLFTEKLILGAQETKLLDSIYGPPPQIKVTPNVHQEASSSLPAALQPCVPPGIDKVWEYDYSLALLGRGETDYFQVQTAGAAIFCAWGSDGLDDWLVKVPGLTENYLDFYADGVYLDDNLTSGTLSFLTDQAPGQGWLVTQAGALYGAAPAYAPEPPTLWLLLVGLYGAARWRGAPCRTN